MHIGIVMLTLGRGVGLAKSCSHASSFHTIFYIVLLTFPHFMTGPLADTFTIWNNARWQNKSFVKQTLITRKHVFVMCCITAAKQRCKITALKYVCRRIMQQARVQKHCNTCKLAFNHDDTCFRFTPVRYYKLMPKDTVQHHSLKTILCYVTLGNCSLLFWRGYSLYDANGHIAIQINTVTWCALVSSRIFVLSLYEWCQINSIYNESVCSTYSTCTCSHCYKSCVAQFKKVIRCCRRQFAAALTPDKQTTWGSQPRTDRLSWPKSQPPLKLIIANLPWFSWDI
jgi:hypothetical protein